MKRKIPLGTVIAKRALVDTKSGAEIVVFVGAPVLDRGGPDWVCPFRIAGLSRDISEYAPGVDGLQALQLVSLAIRHELEKTKREFTWLDQAYWRTGFPKMVVGFGVPHLELSLERAMDQVHKRFIEKLVARRKKAKPQRGVGNR